MPVSSASGRSRLLLDLIATLDEVMLVALLVPALFPRLVSMHRRRVGTAVRCVALLVIFGTSLVLGRDAHAHWAYAVAGATPPGAPLPRS